MMPQDMGQQVPQNPQPQDMGQQVPQNPQPQDQSGGDLSSKIRQAALDTLSPPELQILEQSITPQFVQVMAKLYGDQAVVLLSPLANLQSGMQQGGFTPPGQSAGGALSQFSAPDQTDQNYQPPQMMGNLGMGSGQGNDVCPGCNNPDCPDCQSRQGAPTPVMFGRR